VIELRVALSVVVSMRMEVADRPVRCDVLW